MEDDVVEIDLLQVLNVVKKNLFLFLAICIFTCTCGFAYSKFLIPEKFNATAKIIIVKDESSSSSTVTYNDVVLSQKLASTYKQIILSEAISDEVIANLGLNIGSGAFNSLIKVEAADNTEVMNITASTTDPRLSASIANEVVRVFISKIYDIMDVQNVSILNDAKVPTRKSSPSNTKWGMIGGLVGLVLCAVITIIKVLTDTKVKTEEEVKQIFNDYPIIASIPDFEIKEAE